jgi:TetR/AcrR family transcriptional regulator, mexJK operon transcriptional repressor
MRKSDPILMAAKEAFIESGFGNTSMDDIAHRAGTTKRTVYNNFGSKERLLEAVIDHSILLFETAVPPLGPEADPSQIREFCEVLLQLMTWRAAIGLQRLIISEGPTFPDIATRLSSRISAAMYRPLAQFLESHGASRALAEKSAMASVDRLTSRGRLDRLVGIRQAYPSLPGKNQLDDIDQAAVEDVVRLLCELTVGKQTISSIQLSH